MNKSDIYDHFLDKITTIKDKILKSDLYSEEAIIERISQFCDENGKMDISYLPAYLTAETNDYIAIILSNLLTDLAENGYLTMPDDIDEKTL